MRSPFDRYAGALATVRSDILAAQVRSTLVQQTKIDPADVDDVILGCANQAGEDNRDIARMTLLLADFPVDGPGQTVNRQCGSVQREVANERVAPQRW